MTAAAIVAIATATGVAALIQGICGFGFALVVAPVIATIDGPKSAVTFVTVVGLVIPLGMAWNLRAHLDRPLAARLTGTSMLGLPVGLAALLFFSPTSLKALIAIGVIGSVVFLWRRPHFDHPGAPLDLGAGMVAEALATSTGTNGPPLVLALQARHLAPDPFRATYSVISVATNLVVTVVLLVSGQFQSAMVRPILWSLPLLIVGWQLGAWARERISDDRFRSIVLTLLVVSALVSLGAALS